MPTSAELPGIVGGEGRAGASAPLLLSARRVGRLGACGSAIARATPRQHGPRCRRGKQRTVKRAQTDVSASALLTCPMQVRRMFGDSSCGVDSGRRVQEHQRWAAVCGPPVLRVAAPSSAGLQSTNKLDAERKERRCICRTVQPLQLL